MCLNVRCLDECVKLCVSGHTPPAVSVPLSMFCVFILSKSDSDDRRCCYLLTLHWVSSTPRSANRRWNESKVREGEMVTIHVYMFTQGLFFVSFYLYKVYLPYSGFYCGIIPYEGYHWVLHHFVPIIQKKWEKNDKREKKSTKKYKKFKNGKKNSKLWP